MILYRKKDMEELDRFTVESMGINGEINGRKHGTNERVSYPVVENFIFVPISRAKDNSLNVYQVPFAYEHYGHIQVKAASEKEAWEEAAYKLEKMNVSEMEEQSSYLSDSECIDYEGLLLDAFGNIVEGGLRMWYGVETIFIDGDFFGSRCLFDEGDTGPKGHCYSLEREPMNTCQKEFDDRIEIHVDWFETEELAKSFRDGKITYQHIYDAYHKKSIKTTLRKFRKREIIPVEGRIKPWRGVYIDNLNEKEPYWIRIP